MSRICHCLLSLGLVRPSNSNLPTVAPTSVKLVIIGPFFPSFFPDEITAQGLCMQLGVLCLCVACVSNVSLPVCLLTTWTHRRAGLEFGCCAAASVVVCSTTLFCLLPPVLSTFGVDGGRCSLNARFMTFEFLTLTPHQNPTVFFINVFIIFLLGVVPQRHHSSDCHRHRHSILDIRLRAAAASDIDVHPRPKPGHHPGRRDGVLAHLRALAVLRGSPVSATTHSPTHPPTANHSSAPAPYTMSLARSDPPRRRRRCRRR